MRMDMPYEAEWIIEKIRSHGFEAFAVGGCVRDTLLGRTPEDWDITTSAKPEEIKAIFGKTVDTGLKHGTVTIIKNRRGYEVTTYRMPPVQVLPVNPVGGYLIAPAVFDNRHGSMF